MTEKLKTIKDKIELSKKTQSVVKTMKTFSAAKIYEFLSSEKAIKEYKEIISSLLTVLAINNGLPLIKPFVAEKRESHYIIIGSDHGMVGRFNDTLIEYMMSVSPPKEETEFIVIGQLMANSLFGCKIKRTFTAPVTTDKIPELIADILSEIGLLESDRGSPSVSVFYNKPSSKQIYEAVHQKLLPLSYNVIKPFIKEKWETIQIPQLICQSQETYAKNLLQEFLYISLFGMCSSSLLVEHKTRLASMREAEKNIEDLINRLKHEYNQVRQDVIDRELFDIIAGFRTKED